MKIFEEHDAKAFLSKVDRKLSLQLRALFRFLLFTGVRPSEAYALKWESVDFVKQTVTIAASVTYDRTGKWTLSAPKTVKGKRTLLLPDHLVNLLLEHERNQRHTVGRQDFVFSRKDGSPLKHEYIQREVFRPLVTELRQDQGDILAKADKGASPDVLCAEYGYPVPVLRHWIQARSVLPEGLTCYSLRHTCACLALQAGVKINTVSSRLGHADVSITLQHYIHRMTNDEQELVSRLDGVLS